MQYVALFDHIMLYIGSFPDFPSWAFMKDLFLDREGWQAMLDREAAPGAAACIGLLRREDFAARQGTLLVWCGEAGGLRAALREYSGEAAADVAMLLVVDGEAVQTLRSSGLAPIRSLLRQGRLQAYMLKTMDELESAGLADFVEDLGLVFPKH